MIEVGIIFKLAALGVCIAIINDILEKFNAKDWKTYISIIGVIMGLYLVLDYVKTFFDVVQTFAM